jgi:hypothetical protein
MGPRQLCFPWWARVLPSLCVVSVLAGCGTASDSASNAEETQVKATYFVSQYGVRVGISAEFDQTREITDARLLWDDQSDEIGLYPTDGTDPGTPPDSITVQPGEPTLLEGDVVAACPEEPSLPVFEVVSRYEDAEHTDRFVPAEPSSFKNAFAKWCRRSVSMHVTGSSATPEGDYELRVEFANPGPFPVEMISERVEDATSTWQRASVIVPAGSIKRLTILGHGPPECAAVPPWETGHVRADGEIVTPSEDNGWC